VADNVAITAGSGTTVATEERTINSVAVQVQRVDEIGSLLIAAGQVTPTTAAGTLVAARDTRKRLILFNKGSCDCFIGPATVTTSSGVLPVGYSLVLYTTALVQAIIATGTMSGYVSYIEEYD
jgi:hypothetical protein